MAEDLEGQPLVEGTKPFSRVLAQMEQGKLDAELADAMRELVGTMSQYVADGGGDAAGKIQLALAFKLDKGGIMEIRADLKVNAPKMARERSLFWLTPGNQLTAENPKQPDLFPKPRALPADPAVRKDVK